MPGSRRVAGRALGAGRAAVHPLELLVRKPPAATQVECGDRCMTGRDASTISESAWRELCEAIVPESPLDELDGRARSLGLSEDERSALWLCGWSWRGRLTDSSAPRRWPDAEHEVGPTAHD